MSDTQHIVSGEIDSDRGNSGSRKFWGVIALVAACLIILGLVVTTKYFGSGSASSSVHKAAGDDGGTSSDSKSPSDPPPVVKLDLAPLNDTLGKMNATMNGMGDNIALKLEASNAAIASKLDLLLAQKDQPDPTPAPDALGKGDDTVPCPPEEVLTIEDRVANLEGWQTGVDEQLAKHTRQIRRINRRLDGLGKVPVAELPGVQTATEAKVETHSMVLNLKHDQ